MPTNEDEPYTSLAATRAKTEDWVEVDAEPGASSFTDAMPGARVFIVQTDDPNVVPRDVGMGHLAEVLGTAPGVAQSLTDLLAQVRERWARSGADDLLLRVNEEGAFVAVGDPGGWVFEVEADTVEDALRCALEAAP